jgi:hypothetical protein
MTETKRYFEAWACFLNPLDAARATVDLAEDGYAFEQTPGVTDPATPAAVFGMVTGHTTLSQSEIFNKVTAIVWPYGIADGCGFEDKPTSHAERFEMMTGQTSSRSPKPEGGTEMSGEDDRTFYRTLSMIRAVTTYLDVDGFERRYANAKSDLERFECGGDLFGRLAAAIGQFAVVASRSKTDAAIKFKGWWPHEYGIRKQVPRHRG